MYHLRKKYRAIILKAIELIYSNNYEGGKFMEIQENEMKEEEVNIYTDDCGMTRLDCVTDCFLVSPFLTEVE